MYSTANSTICLHLEGVISFRQVHTDLSFTSLRVLIGFNEVFTGGGKVPSTRDTADSHTDMNYLQMKLKAVLAIEFVKTSFGDVI